MKSDNGAAFVDANALVYAALKDDPRNEASKRLLGYEHVGVLRISEEAPPRWISLLKTVKVKGPIVFDLLIVATMLIYDVSKLFTYNGGDFKRFTGIVAIEPGMPEKATD